MLFVHVTQRQQNLRLGEPLFLGEPPENSALRDGGTVGDRDRYTTICYVARDRGTVG